MKYRKLDSNGDYTFGNGLENFYSSVEAVTQAIRTKLLLLYGEWWEDKEEGTPLFQVFSGKSNTQTNIQAMDLVVRDRIFSTPGVTAIVNFKSAINSRVYTVTATIDTVYGNTVLEVSL